MGSKPIMERYRRVVAAFRLMLGVNGPQGQFNCFAISAVMFGVGYLFIPYLSLRFYPVAYRTCFKVILVFVHGRKPHCYAQSCI